MLTTTGVVHHSTVRTLYHRHGYFFREAASLTIAMGVVLHVLRIVLGDQLALQYVITPTVDRILLVPMAYAGVTGIALLANKRVVFSNRRHRALFTGSVVYIVGSVPLHVYCSYIAVDTTIVMAFPMWVSWLLLAVVYPAFLTLFVKVRYQN
ncbi:hypothetical protein E4P42_25285 [Mycobacterium sp. PS03-16]|uniref:hypothetical protein n=1 Tax=Mycobacterium sp. PS03-16 TaxID=2559611 RepID=UPI001073B6E0|nr:hypothetical protein [Mycobacterium sp. PS03-16]TFV54651.1 hypothetical protein E4P42_25285 [Mycobacterium sp. PS03-16]